jgi:hypothetical protein
MPAPSAHKGTASRATRTSAIDGIPEWSSKAPSTDGTPARAPRTAATEGTAPWTAGAWASIGIPVIAFRAVATEGAAETGRTPRMPAPLNPAKAPAASINKVFQQGVTVAGSPSSYVENRVVTSHRALPGAIRPWGVVIVAQVLIPFACTVAFALGLPCAVPELLQLAFLGGFLFLRAVLLCSFG